MAFQARLTRTLQIALLWLLAPIALTIEASSWNLCGQIDLPTDYSVATHTHWLRVSQHGTRVQLYCGCSSLPQLLHQPVAVSLQINGPCGKWEQLISIPTPCSRVGCWWNPSHYLTLPPGAMLEDQQHFVYTQSGLVQFVRFKEENIETIRFIVPLTLSTNLTKVDVINITHSLAFDVSSCLSAASGNSLVLSVTPLSELALAANNIHKMNVYSEARNWSPASSSMMHALIRMLRQSGNTPPRFSSLYYSEQVLENNEPGITVGTVVASDLDLGVEGQVMYSLVANNDVRVLDLLTIHPQTGAISVNRVLDHEIMPLLSVRVQATDGAGETGVTTFTLEVIDVNDNHPTFQQGSYHNLSLSENTPVTAEVIQLVVVDEDSGVNGQVTFTLLDNPDQTFNLIGAGNQATIVLQQGLDYETETGYLLTVLAHDGGSPTLSSLATVELHIRDEADTLPIFTAPSYSVDVEEDTPPLVSLLAVHAQSMDSSELAGVEYFIVGGNLDGCFSLNHMTGNLSLIKLLDYERTQAYLLRIQAQLTVNPTLRSSINVHINIGNVNDHAPIFSRSQYSVSVLESVGVSTHVVTVTADDLDLGTFGEVTYSFVPGTESVILNTFVIHPTSGALVTQTPLDREQRQLYSFTIQASDGGVPALISGVTVVIRVTDVNDERPVFSESEYSELILENLAAGSEVIRVWAMDSDSESNSIEYYIQSGNHGNAFTIGTSSGLIMNRIYLDREQRSEYTLIVIATDLQFESEPVQVHITVVDENDEHPIFQTSLYSPPPVHENTPIGTELLIVLATDRDEGNNAILTYSSPDIDPSLYLDPSSGAVTVAQSLDYDSAAQKSFSFTVQAIDGGDPPNTANTRVEITLSDDNDNAPIFETVELSVGVAENQPAHTLVLQLSASDADSGLNSDLVYEVVGDTEAVSVFGVYQSGMLHTLRPLDRERRDHYQVVVQVSDRGVEPLSDDITVRVSVEDEIDYPPIFTQLLYNIRVTMETSANSELVQVEATTLDLQSSILYDITSGEHSLFRINQDTGVIIATATLDPVQDQKEYILQVTAQHFHLSATVPVVVTVMEDDGILRLHPLTVYFNVFESELSELNFLSRVRLANPIDELQYSFSLMNSDPSVQRYFMISERGGELSVRRGVVSGVYSLNVSVSSGVAAGHGQVKLYVRVLTNATLSEAVVATFVGLSEASFIVLQLEQFAGFVAKALDCERERVELFSLQEGAGDTVLLAFAVRDQTSLRYVDQDTVTDQLLANQHLVRPSSLAGYNTENCISEPCPNLQLCRPVVTITTYRPGIPHRMFHLGRNVYISQPFQQDHTCFCPHGYNRFDLCASVVDLCDPSPCQFDGECVNNVLEYHCNCPSGTMGKNCSIVCPSLSCDPCLPTPCLYEGVCSTSEKDYAHYICNECPWGSEYSGPNCELTSLSFNQGSFVAFSKLLFSANVKFSLYFVTVAPNGLLFYNGHISGRHDYISVELVIGQLRVGVSYGDAPTIVRTVSPQQLNDGEWHSVEVEVREGVLGVRVGGCGPRSVAGVEHYCELTAMLIGQKRTLDLTTPLYIGGLEPHIQRSEFISSTSYTGCIANITIGGVLFDLNNPLRSGGVAIGCPPHVDKCSDLLCPSGECVDVWNGTVCNCEGETPHCGTGGSVQLLPGFIQVSLTSPTSLSRLSVKFRTRSSIAVLARLGTAGSLELNYGSVVFRRSHDSTLRLTALTLIVDGGVNDGYWHRITLSTTLTHTKLSLDDDRISSHTPEGGALPIHTIILGADTALASSSRFIGCLGELVLNNMRIDISSALITTSTDYIVTHGGVANGCDSGNPCASAQCPDSTTCVDNWRDHSCVCAAHNHRLLDGACVNPCSSAPCLNGGTCIVPPLTSAAIFQCSCHSPFTGVRCEAGRDCELGFHGDQCERCRCDPDGVGEGVCDRETGDCICKDGNYYSGSGDLGCKSCNCHVIGSTSSACHPLSGQCPCRPNVIGRRCERCASGYAGLDQYGCKEATLLFGGFSLALSYSSFYDNMESEECYDLLSHLSNALERELMTFALPGRLEVTLISVKNSSGLTTVEYQVAHYFPTGGHTHLSHPSINTLGSAVQVIVQSGWVGPHRLITNSHTLPQSCDLFPAVCEGCPPGTRRDGVICRPLGLCLGHDSDRDGVPDSCDNCTLTFNPDQNPSACVVIEGICPVDVASDVVWSATVAGSIDIKPCPLPFAGLATRKCEVSGVWEKVDTLACLSLVGQQLLEQASALSSGQLLSIDQLLTTLTGLITLTSPTSENEPHPLTGGDVQAAGKLLSQIISVLPGYATGQARGLLQNCSQIASNLLQPMLSSHWSTPVPNIGFTAQDFLQSLEQLFSISGLLEVSSTQEHLAVSSFQVESPSVIAIGNKALIELWLPSELSTFITSFGAVSGLGQWLPRLFVNSNLIRYTVATPLLLVQESEVKTLTTPINMTLPYHSALLRSAESSESAQCVYWEYDRGWSTSGCGILLHNQTHTSCTCSHLSVFAVLLPEDSFLPLHTQQSYTPEIFTYIILSLVVLVMVVCFVVLACLPLARTLQSCVHMNLIVCLGLTAVSWLVGVARVEIPGVCAGVGVVLVFLGHASLSWVLADAIIIARFLLSPPPRTNFALYLVIVGWVLPVFLCGIPLGTVAVMSDSFIQDMGYPDFCWLSTRVVYAFAVPAAVLLLLFTIAIGFSFITLHKMTKDSDSAGLASSMSKHKVRMALVVSIATMLLILATWMLALLTLYVEKMLEYLFSVAWALLASFLCLTLTCSSQVREAAKNKLKKTEPQSTPNFSRAVNNNEREEGLMGMYAEVELVPVPSQLRPHLHRHHTQYVRPFQNPRIITTSTTVTSQELPIANQNDWFVIPEPVPLSPLTSDSDHNEPIYSQVLRSHKQNSFTDDIDIPHSTEVDYTPSLSLTEVYNVVQGKRGDSPESYLEAEPTLSLRRTDPLWYQQRDSASVEVDPLPYETAIQSPVKTPEVARQRSLSEDWLACKKVYSSELGNSSPGRHRLSQQSLASHNPQALKPSPPKAAHTNTKVNLKGCLDGVPCLLNQRLAQMTPAVGSSGSPSSLQVHVDQYHRDGPSAMMEASHVIRHADGSETVQSLV